MLRTELQTGRVAHLPQAAVRRLWEGAEPPGAAVGEEPNLEVGWQRGGGGTSELAGKSPSENETSGAAALVSH